MLYKNFVIIFKFSIFVVFHFHVCPCTPVSLFPSLRPFHLFLMLFNYLLVSVSFTDSTQDIPVKNLHPTTHSKILFCILLTYAYRLTILINPVLSREPRRFFLCY